MSALGQKQTYAVQEAMSALAPKADMCDANRNVSYWPKADIVIYWIATDVGANLAGAVGLIKNKMV